MGVQVGAGCRIVSSGGLLVSPRAEMPPPVLRVLNALAANSLRDWKAAELTAAAKVSYSVLRAFFQKLGQVTIHENIHHVRLDQSRLLLTDEWLSVKAVAAQLNFSNEFYFSHFFRQHTHMSPTEFRRRLKQ